MSKRGWTLVWKSTGERVTSDGGGAFRFRTRREATHHKDCSVGDDGYLMRVVPVVPYSDAKPATRGRGRRRG